MTRHADGTIEQQAIAPALMEDLIRENQDAEASQESPYRHHAAVKRVDRDPRAIAEEGIGNKALEGALRRSIGPLRTRRIALDIGPTQHEPGAAFVEADAPDAKHAGGGCDLGGNV